MAKRITTGKRDREKLKEQKRKEKSLRKEERQSSSGGSGLDDMLAYVDENGVLHSTPQEKSKEVIDASEISISVPKQEDIEAVPLEGRIEYFNTQKGFGFVKDGGSSEKYFFHISSAPESINEGDRVTFELERGTRGMNAVQISVINKQ